MKEFSVLVETITTTYWNVDAETKEDATANYEKGTKDPSDTQTRVVHVEEV